MRHKLSKIKNKILLLKNYSSFRCAILYFWTIIVYEIVHWLDMLLVKPLMALSHLINHDH